MSLGCRIEFVDYYATVGEPSDKEKEPPTLLGQAKSWVANLPWLRRPTASHVLHEYSPSATRWMAPRRDDAAMPMAEDRRRSAFVRPEGVQRAAQVSVSV